MEMKRVIPPWWPRTGSQAFARPYAGHPNPRGQRTRKQGPYLGGWTTEQSDGHTAGYNGGPASTRQEVHRSWVALDAVDNAPGFGLTDHRSDKKLL